MICSVKTETETVEVLLTISEVIWNTSKNNTFLKKSKIFSLKSKTKPHEVWIIYLSPSQKNFLESLNKNFSSTDKDAKETYCSWF